MRRKLTKEQKIVNRIFREMLFEPSQMFCRGCDVYTKNLDPSHIIRRSRRADLITNPLNITAHCNEFVNGCHAKWDSGNIKKMKSLLDFDKNLEIIKQLDKDYYNYILNFKIN